ncbi:MAG: hypothetical protein PVI23_11325 [Maricaulaceae bacterium]|jgi:hypothetical protein
MTEGYKLTASGLLRKRRDLVREVDGLRERLTAIGNDIAVLDQALQVFGIAPPETAPARSARIVVFCRGELRAFIHDALTAAERPLTTRELSALLLDDQGRDIADRRVRNETMKRVGKALRQMAQAGCVVKEQGERPQDVSWSLAQGADNPLWRPNSE